jgi:putative peptidoglycan lipid II flippase
MKHAGVALATSAGFWVNFVLLALFLRRKLGPLGGREVVRSLARTSVASLVMGAAVFFVAERLLPYDAAWRLLARAGWVVGLAAAGGLLFVAASAALGSPEVEEVFGAFRRRKDP